MKQIKAAGIGFFIFFSLFLWYDAPTMAMAQDTPEGFEFIQEIQGIREYKLLSNGLSVLLSEDHSAPVATVMVTYLVGSRHENDEFRGGAHLLEHMMFKGTPTYNQERGNTIARVLQSTGAVLNASTWKDGTNYFETLPSDKLSLALEIEADRMRNSLLKAEDLKFEMPVVQSEFDRLENSPLAALDHAVWRTAYRRHTYQFPIIGIREDIERMPIGSLKKFYDTYYWPDKAVLAVIGDFKTAGLLETIREKFGKIPSSDIARPPSQASEPAQKETRTVTVEREDQIEAVYIAHKIPEAKHPDSVPLDVLSFILSHGKANRMYRALVDNGLAVEVSSENSKSYDPGLFITEVILTSQARHEDVLQIVLTIYDKVKKEGVTEEEFERAKNQLRAEVAYSRDGSYSVAEQLSRAIAAGDWALFAEYLDKLEKVALQDVTRVANQYLVGQGMSIGYLRSKNPAISHDKRPPAAAQVLENLEKPDGTPKKEKKADAGGLKQPHAAHSHIMTAELSKRVQTSDINGIRTFSVRTETEDVVTLMGSFEGAGQAYSENPLVPILTVSLLDEGTQDKDKFEIARLLEDRGARISFQIDHRHVGFHARCLKQDMELVISLIAEQMQQPRFDNTEFLKQVEQQRVHLQYALTDTSAQAQAALSRTIYPPEHPYYEIPYEEQLKLLEKVRLEQIKSFHQSHYGKQKMTVVAAGDIDHEAFKNAVGEHFQNWKAAEIKEKFSLAALPDVPPAKKTVLIPDKTKVDVLFGHGLPLTRHSEDYLAVYIGNAILGGDFSARLSSIVRDRQGLTYHVHSELHGVEQDLEGHWEINIILNNRLLQKGIAATISEIDRFVREGVNQSELSDKKETLKGKFKVSLSTSGGLARQLLRNHELGFTLEYLDDYPRLVERLTLPEVNRAIKKYFSAKELHQIIAGTVNEPAQNPSL